MFRISLIMTFLVMAGSQGFAAQSEQLSFSGALEAVLCEKLQTGQFQVLDRIFDSNHDVSFQLSAPPGLRQLNTAHSWNGQTQNGLSIGLRQAGPSRINLNFETQSIAVDVSWDITISGKNIRLHFRYSSAFQNFPPGVSVNLDGPGTQLNDSLRTATLKLKGFELLDANAANVVAGVLRASNKKDKEWKHHQLYLAVVFVGNVKGIGK